MKKLISCLSVLLVLLHAHSQDGSLLIHQSESGRYNARPRKVVVTYTSYGGPLGKQVTQTHKFFDVAGMLRQYEQYGSKGKLVGRWAFVNDTVQRRLLLATNLEIPVSKETFTTVYRYNDRGALAAVIEKEPTGNISWEMTVACNDSGHPIQVKILDRNGDVVRTEESEYRYAENKVFRTLRGRNGEIESIDSFKIDYKLANLHPWPGEAYNERGDLIKLTRRNKDGTLVVSESIYTYDRFGNHTRIETFRVTTNSSGDKKRELTGRVETEYTY